MKRYPIFRVMFSAVILAMGLSPAVAGTVVKVELQDPSTADGGGSMQMKLDRDSVPTGQICFEAVNDSKALEHEMILVKTDQDPSAFPYDAKKDRVVEFEGEKPRRGSRAEAWEIRASFREFEAGKLRSLLQPGRPRASRHVGSLERHGEVERNQGAASAAHSAAALRPSFPGRRMEAEGWRSSTSLRNSPVWLARASATSSGVPVATMVPPPSPPSGPRSMM